MGKSFLISTTYWHTFEILIRLSEEAAINFFAQLIALIVSGLAEATKHWVCPLVHEAKFFWPKFDLY